MANKTAKTKGQPAACFIGWLASKQGETYRRDTLRVMLGLMTAYAVLDVEPGVHAPEREAPRIPPREMASAGTIRVPQMRRTQRDISGFARPESEIVAAPTPQARLSIKGTAAFAHPIVAAAKVTLPSLG